MIGPVGAVRRLDGVAAARRLAGWLALAATPTFAIMAVLTAMIGGGPADMLCGAGQGFLLGGMVPMYLDECVSCRRVAEADCGAAGCGLSVRRQPPHRVVSPLSKNKAIRVSS